MKEIITKIAGVIIYIIGFPIFVLILGFFMWFTSLIDFITE